ncbi:MAG: RNase adapter RapZ [Qipengyuania sp.]
MDDDSPLPRAQRILLVTGLSGAGKSTALQVLEDLGWEAIDNFPVRLLKRLLSKDECQVAPLAIGVDSRTRGFIPSELVRTIAKLDQREDLSFEVLFFDCSSGEIERRFNETRRRHPMARGRPVIEGVKAERELLELLRSWAEMVIDTTDYSSHQLQQAVRERFADAVSQELTITITSFGFARGMPPIADLVFDMRFLDNPHWVEGLRPQTGLDGPVGAHIAKDPAFVPEFARISDLVLSLVPRYASQGRAYLTVAFGCTGGRHRSVYCAEQMAEKLREAGYDPTVIHRNLSARTADRIEER